MSGPNGYLFQLLTGVLVPAALIGMLVCLLAMGRNFVNDPQICTTCGPTYSQGWTL